MAEPSPKEKFRAAVDVLSQMERPPTVVSPVLQDALDPDPALRVEISTARDQLAPSIRGLHGLSAVSQAIGAVELEAVIDLVIAGREMRRALLQAVLDALDAVVAARRALAVNGYPDVPEKTIDATLFAQLAKEIGDFLAAFSVFSPDLSQASKIAITFGAPVPKA